MFSYLNLASGSKGNSSLVFDESNLIVIDIGVTKSLLIEGLESIGKSIDDIDIILITHNHIDHIKTLKYIDISKVRFVASAIKDKNFKKINKLNYYQSFDIGKFDITPLRLSHDAPCIAGYLIKHENEELVYITDTGYIPLETINLIKNKNYYIFESNHDINMLLESNRSINLKTRILSIEGHLSNDLASKYLIDLIGDKTKKILLAHLSEECNTAELALKTFSDLLEKDGIYSLNINVRCLSQYKWTLL